MRKDIFDTLGPALRLLVVLTLLTGGLYPLAVTGVSKALFPAQAAGSLLVKDGKTVGSRLIGQQWNAPGYFWGRPSATTMPAPETATAPNAVNSPVAAPASEPPAPLAAPYNAASSSGSNQGPLNPAFLEAVAERKAALLAASCAEPVPVDLVTASGSGLDPHISPAAAIWQVDRVAKARGLERAAVASLVGRHVEGRFLGILGEPRVNVLELNMALDTLGTK